MLIVKFFRLKQNNERALYVPIATHPYEINSQYEIKYSTQYNTSWRLIHLFHRFESLHLVLNVNHSFPAQVCVLAGADLH